MHPINQIDAYLAGDLTPADRFAFEQHIAGCPECAGMVEDVRDTETLLTDVFYPVRPSDDFEDRLVKSLRGPLHASQPRSNRQTVDSWVRWVGVGLAATVAIGFVGLVANSIFRHKTSAMVGTLAAILPGHESADSGAMTSGSLIETTNDGGTIQINAAAATDSSNSDRLDFNTGLSSQEASTSVLALDVDNQS